MKRREDGKHRDTPTGKRPRDKFRPTTLFLLSAFCYSCSLPFAPAPRVLVIRSYRLFNSRLHRCCSLCSSCRAEFHVEESLDFLNRVATYSGEPFCSSFYDLTVVKNVDVSLNCNFLQIDDSQREEDFN